MTTPENVYAILADIEAHEAALQKKRVALEELRSRSPEAFVGSAALRV